MPVGWTRTRIGKFLHRVSSEVDVVQGTDYREIGIRSHGKGIFHKQPTTGMSLGEKRVFWVEPNCLIFNIVFAWEQAVARTCGRDVGFIASHRFPMYRVDDKLAELDYLVYFFKSPLGKHLLTLASPGGAGRNKTLGQEELASIHVSLPPRAHQTEYAELLATWDHAITLTERLIAAKQQLRRSLMQQLLTGKRRFPGFSEPWREVRLGDVFERVTRTATEEDGELEPLSITAGTGIVLQKDKFSRVIAGKNLERYVLLRRGEFSYNKGNSKRFPQGCIYRLHDLNAGLVPNVFYSFRAASEDVHPEFFEHFFDGGGLNHALSRVINTGVRNDGLLNLDADAFFKVTIPLPPADEQKRVAELLHAGRDELSLLQTQLAALKTQKHGLMQQLLTGKVRVTLPDVDENATSTEAEQLTDASAGTVAR